MTQTSESILVLGAYGRLGLVLSRSLAKFHNILRQGRNKDAQIYLPNINKDSLANIIEDNDITVVINLIAMTDVGDCEVRPSDAFFANAIIPKYIRAAIDEVNNEIFVLHVSTDQVYSGGGLLDENFSSPCNVYSASKLAGEHLIGSSNNTCILRTNYFGLSEVSNKSSYLDWLVDSIKRDQRINTYEDVFFTPVGSQTLCSVILAIIDQGTSGTYNFGSSKSISKAEFAFLVANILGVSSPNFECIEYPADAVVKRPKNMSMESQKLLNELNLDPIDVEIEVKRELRLVAV
jgi:dTDP-4-dehydrorhamnose reductase